MLKVVIPIIASIGTNQTIGVLGKASVVER